MGTRVIVKGGNNEPGATIPSAGDGANITIGTGEDTRIYVYDPDPDLWLDALAAKCQEATRKYRGEPEPASEPAEPVVPEGMALIEGEELDRLRRNADALAAIRVALREEAP